MRELTQKSSIQDEAPYIAINNAHGISTYKAQIKVESAITWQLKEA